MQLTLFDLPPPAPKDRGGRPTFKKTKQNHRLVVRLIRLGYSQPEIAARVGCSVPTLRRHFSGILLWRARWGIPTKN